MTDLPASVIKFPKPGHASYQEALRAQLDCQLESVAREIGQQAAYDGLQKAISEAYAVLGPDEGCWAVQWAHNKVHVDYTK